MNKKQLDILDEKFNVYTYDDGSYSLEAWTDGGVDMCIDFDKDENIVEGLKKYVETFDIDDEIDLYRQDKSYRENFRITESIKDFENWIEFINDIIKQLEEVI